jgi:Holliday junction resolvasome RuvABC ATP-dependent DNA helicase subunit
VFEPHLLRSGLVQKTARGRVVTPEGCAAIGVDPKKVAGAAGTLF